MAVLGLAFVELWAAVPAGLALGLHPLLTAITAAVGSTMSAMVVIMLGTRLRSWLLRRFGGKNEGGRQGYLRRVWNRHGVVGLGLLSPLLFGAPLGAALGASLGAAGGRLLFWMGVGIALWSLLLTLVGVLGLTGLEWLLGT